LDIPLVLESEAGCTIALPILEQQQLQSKTFSWAFGEREISRNPIGFGQNFDFDDVSLQPKVGLYVNFLTKISFFIYYFVCSIKITMSYRHIRKDNEWEMVLESYKQGFGLGLIYRIFLIY
jgi:hypothetical protein